MNALHLTVAHIKLIYAAIESEEAASKANDAELEEIVQAVIAYDADGLSLYPSDEGRAAVYISEIVTRRPFPTANNVTAWFTAMVYLNLVGWKPLSATPEHVVRLCEAVQDGEAHLDEIIQFILNHTEIPPEPKRKPRAPFDHGD